MADNIEMTATSRETVGKSNRKLDHSLLPAVVYGAAVKAMPVSVDRHAFGQVLAHEGNISSKLIDLKIDGAKSLHVIVKDMQHDPLKGYVQHVDFWAVNMKQAIQTTVPIHFEGDAPGVRTGGVLMHSVQHINVEALPDKLPEALTYDVSMMEIGDTVHVRDLVAPEGATILDDPDELVATIVPPVAEEEEPEAEETAAEPELIGEKPDEE
jgi:large subunit ribosomal protein L25